MSSVIRKVLIFLLALILILTTMIACTPTSDTTDEPDVQEDEKDIEETPPADTDDEGDEDTELSEVELEPYELTYFILCNSISQDRDMIVEQLNSIIQPKINATIDLVLLDWGTWNERFPTAMNAGEKIDIAFTAEWWGYLDGVANNFFRPLNDPEDDLLAQYAPKVVENLGEGFIVGSQVDGVNYGVPTDKEFAVNGGFVWRKDLADKYELDMSSVNTVEDLEPMLAVIKENEPNIIPYLVETGGSRYTIPFASFAANMGVDYSIIDDTDVKFIWDREDVIQMSKTHKKYYDLGYIHKDAHTDNNRSSEHLLEGDFFVTQQPLKPFKGKSTELMAAAGDRFTLDEKEITPYVGISLHAAGSMLAIPTTSEDPARAMMFINLLHTDPNVSNLLVWGIEGVHHKVVQDGDPKIVAPIPDNTWTAAALPWTLGNVFQHWLGETEDLNKHEGFRLTKENSPSHITLGYRFLHTAKYQAEIAAIDNALAEYSTVLSTGAVKDFDAAYNKMISDAEAAGLRTVQKAVQDDLNEWLEKMGKK